MSGSDAQDVTGKAWRAVRSCHSLFLLNENGTSGRRPAFSARVPELESSKGEFLLVCRQHMIRNEQRNPSGLLNGTRICLFADLAQPEETWAILIACPSDCSICIPNPWDFPYLLELLLSAFFLPKLNSSGFLYNVLPKLNSLGFLYNVEAMSYYTIQHTSCLYPCLISPALFPK